MVRSRLEYLAAPTCQRMTQFLSHKILVSTKLTMKGGVSYSPPSYMKEQVVDHFPKARWDQRVPSQLGTSLMSAKLSFARVSSPATRLRAIIPPLRNC